MKAKMIIYINLKIALYLYMRILLPFIIEVSENSELTNNKSRCLTIMLRLTTCR